MAFGMADGVLFIDVSSFQGVLIRGVQLLYMSLHVHVCACNKLMNLFSV